MRANQQTTFFRLFSRSSIRDRGNPLHSSFQHTHQHVHTHVSPPPCQGILCICHTMPIKPNYLSSICFLARPEEKMPCISVKPCTHQRTNQRTNERMREWILPLQMFRQMASLYPMTFSQRTSRGSFSCLSTSGFVWECHEYQDFPSMGE